MKYLSVSLYHPRVMKGGAQYVAKDLFDVASADAEVDAVMRRAEVPSGPILDARGIAEDPQYAARGMLEPVTLPDGTAVKMPGVVPVLTRTPGRADTAGPALGEHNAEIYGELLGLDERKLAALRDDGVI